MNTNHNHSILANDLRPLLAVACGVAASLHCVALAEPGETGRTLTLFHEEAYEDALQNIREGDVDLTPEILYYVGYCREYALGGASKDLEKAQELYEKAAAGGSDKAKRRLDELEKEKRSQDEKKRIVKENKALKDKQAEMEAAKKRVEAELGAKLQEWQTNRDNEIRLHESEIAALKEKLEEAKKKGDDAVVGNIRKSLSEAEVRHSRALQNMERELGEMKRELNDMEGKYNVRFEHLHNAIAGLHVDEKRETEMGMPFGFAMFAPGQFPPVEADVTGFRLSVFYGRNRNVFGLDVGALVSVADGDLMGLQVSGLFNQIGSSSGALQIGGIANVCADSFLGFQIAGIANRVEGDCAGLQVGTLNLASKDMVGVQIGAFNNAKNAKGLQVGVVNHAVKMTGVQIGLINLIDESSVSCLPVVNAHF